MKQQKQVSDVGIKQVQTQGINILNETIKVLKPIKLHDFISELEITSDSVVAKLRVVTNSSTRRIFVDWGDLESDIISIRPGISLDNSPVLGLPNPLPDGTYEIFHAYAEPEERQTFERQITVRIQDHSGSIDQRSTTLTLKPKYKITIYRAYIRLVDSCDFSAQQSNFEIIQKVAGDDRLRWEWNPSNGFISESVFSVLPSSQFSRVLEVGSGRIHFSYEFREKDGFLNSDDKGAFNSSINYLTESANVEQNISVADPNFGVGCKVKIKFDIEVSLFRPLPSIGGLATFANAQA